RCASGRIHRSDGGIARPAPARTLRAAVGHGGGATCVFPANRLATLDVYGGGAVKKYGRLLGSLILVGLLVWRIDWRQVASAFAQLEASYWLLALGLYLLTQGVSAARWQIIGHMLGLGGHWRDYLSPYFIGMFFNLVLPTSVGGDVVRAWY